MDLTKEAISARLKGLEPKIPLSGKSYTRITAFLKDLSDDIEADKNLDGWNRLNLSEEADAMLDPTWYSRFVVRFGMLTPIALTWWSIRQATNAYAQLAEYQRVDRSFLYWWVTGMDGRLNWFEFLPNAALLTFLIISCLALTGLMSGRKLARIRETVIRELLIAQIYIGQKITFTPEQIRGSVSTLLNEMVAAGVALSKTSVESLNLIEKAAAQLEILTKFVAAQTSLVGGELKDAVKSSVVASNALTDSLVSSQTVSASLDMASKSLNNSVKPINEMIKGAASLAKSSMSASSTLKNMVDSVPGAFSEPIGAMISAGEYLGQAVSEIMKQMASLDSMFSVVGHGRGAAEIQELLKRIETVSSNIADGQNSLKSVVDTLRGDLSPQIERASNNISSGQVALQNQIRDFSKDLLPLTDTLSSLEKAITNLGFEIKSQPLLSSSDSNKGRWYDRDPK